MIDQSILETNGVLQAVLPFLHRIRDFPVMPCLSKTIQDQIMGVFTSKHQGDCLIHSTERSIPLDPFVVEQFHVPIPSSAIELCGEAFWLDLTVSQDDVAYFVGEGKDDDAQREVLRRILRWIKTTRWTGRGSWIHSVRLSFLRHLDDELLIEFLLPEDSLWIGGKTGLLRFSLEGCRKITNQGILEVSKVGALWSNLQSLCIFWNENITARGYRRLLRGTNVRELTFPGAPGIDDTVLMEIATHFKDLTHLDLTRCTKITADGISAILENLTKLQYFRAYANQHIESNGFRKLGNLLDLVYLDLCGCLVEDDQLASLFEGNSLLRALNLSWCIKLTGKIADLIAQRLTRLDFLSLHGLDKVKSTSMQEIAKSPLSKTLKAFDISGTCLDNSDYLRNCFVECFPNVTLFRIAK